MTEQDVALERLRAHLAAEDYPLDTRLPSERELCELIGVGRAALRCALARLEEDGYVWRHVGRGTFAGYPPCTPAVDMQTVARSTSPTELLHARLMLEPQMAALAALNATAADLDGLARIGLRLREARGWTSFAAWDQRWHRALALASRNPLLLAIHDTLATVRRTVQWAPAEAARRPRIDRHACEEHDRILAAVAARDVAGAMERTRDHLEGVKARAATGENLAEAFRAGTSSPGAAAPPRS